MGQQANIKFKCHKDEHLEQIDSVCYSKFCTEFRLNCFQCIIKGTHHAHADDVQKINTLLKFIQNKNKECDQLIEKLDKSIESVYQQYSLLKRGIRIKYSLKEEKFINLNIKQANDALNSMVELTEYQQSITNIIQDQIKKITNFFNNLYEQLKLSSFNYYQIDENDIKQSKEFYAKGYKLYMDTQYCQAIEQFDKSLQFQHNNIDSLSFKGDCLRRLNKYMDAITWLDKALVINPEQISSLSNKGECLKMQSLGQKVLAIDPKHVSSLSNKGDCLRMLNKYEDAITWLEKALVIDPNHVFSLLDKGDCLGLLNMHEDAINWLDKALAIDPKHVFSLSRKGECLRAMKKYNDCLNCLNDALSINPNDNYTLQTKGLCLQDQHKFKEALIYYVQSLNINPNNQWTRNQKEFCENQLNL